MIALAFRLLSMAFCVLLLAACQTPAGRYAQHKDSAPTFVYETPDLTDAVPRYEPYRSFNSRAYEVLGKRYYPMQTGKGFVQQGYASWYGQKFHGHLTSNGETYNMFAMTAAHKTLPLPSFVRVTNLDNNKTAIVRVNDRGPFHSDRIIDLSYAAAQKLGYQQHGTARVKLEVIHFDEDNNVTVGTQPTVPYAQYAGLTDSFTTSDDTGGTVSASVPQQANGTQANRTQANRTMPSAPTDMAGTPALASASGSSPATRAEEIFIQVAAVSDLERARSVSTVLSALYQVPAHIPLINNIYKLRLGPLADRFQAKMLLDELKNNGYPNAYTVEASL
ncbi:septal ring lytic transglycosylase RlpA family protein [Salinimonas sediminis]|uniref:Endolytic peptidoglycan transglycosylase RlpA n=1 Tax=Salinimonas sediminis TaxID=2303538 RepID=A0A346NLL0_9ALTE|nr:septal ring lytic transglycosylase RlpA family protein [Salinimonas sediminis]AXR06417.1 septal ring lytic transglycosylase RlpA family protein [Salinimonas sediminis]